MSENKIKSCKRNLFSDDGSWWHKVQWVEGAMCDKDTCHESVSIVLLLWLKKTDSFVGLWKAWLDKTKPCFLVHRSLSLSPAFHIGICQGKLELLNTQGHSSQRWRPCLLVSILVAKRGSGQCVCTNCLLHFVHRARSAQINVWG